MTGPPGHVTVPEAQAMLGITRQRLYQLIAMGRIPSQKVGRRIWIPQSAINQRLAGGQRLESNNCISASEVAEFFGVDVRTVREWYGAGLLKATKVFNRLCFTPTDIAAFIPPSSGGAGRYPARTGTRKLRGRVYPRPPGFDIPDRGPT